MATLTNYEYVKEIIDNNGYDPPMTVVKIVQYTNAEGLDNNWGIVYSVEVPMGLGDRYEHESPYVNNPKVIWTKEQGLL
jgi:hypothetical protein